MARAAARVGAVEDADAVVREAAAGALEVAGMESVLVALRDADGALHAQHTAGPFADAFAELGAGALRAVARGSAPELRAWMAAHALSDGADLVATWLARGKLPERRARLAMAIAGASTLIGAASAAGLRG
jgi:hypothetical protein